MDYVQKYTKLVDSFIKKDFPDLNNEKIIIKEKKAKWRAHVRYFPWGMILYINEDLRKFPESSIRRILFHELCHLEIFKKEGIIKNNSKYILYRLSSKTREKVEIEAIILMIKKGHGNEVIAALKENLKRKLNYPLSMKEIRYYMNKYKRSK